MSTPRDRMWQAIRKLRVGFTTQDLRAQIRPAVHKDTMQSYLQGLVAAGYLQTAQPSEALKLAQEHIYTLCKDSFDAPRVTRAGQAVTQGLATLAMWRAMRALGEFNYLEIASSASLGEVRVSPASAQAYVAKLAQAGYFKLQKTAVRGRDAQPARYKLVRYTGAHPPAITSRKCVFDRNLGQFTWEQSAQEVCDGS